MRILLNLYLSEKGEVYRLAFGSSKKKIDIKKVNGQTIIGKRLKTRKILNDMSGSLFNY